MTEEACRAIRIGGLAPFSATDYPGVFSAVLFVQGCPWRCGYCHNPHLQPRGTDHAIAWHDIMDLLQRRRGLIDAVVFSGGEPTIDPGLRSAMDDVRGLGFRIGLHTGGIYPDRLADVLPLVDWVGLDIKAPFDVYDTVTQVSGSSQPALRSLEMILSHGTDLECRTTLHPSLLAPDDILRLARSLADMEVENYALQLFRKQGCSDSGLLRAPMHDYPGKSLIDTVRGLFPRFTFREG
ncbi:anaerobic ribonucleoside-triphosphate reductase activating protein [Paracandidimonas soli]|uniref:Anaerobic ribonucleoside-triphosphate reductase activating protein n=1 Tax=Paracandidimonas soli TaxID=1917182 RepID=A0A4R3VFR6_9BURK|nr:anaerobic ribonucleoside-triphosphate reductase activating protein [Paracandidimonas soli]TCV01665.1 anaerobic ribonucleoside-triphosphate reductase activating protein [Paracandidimonas soli]